VDPVGVAAFKAAQAQGRRNSHSSLGEFFGTPQPGPPKETRLGPRGGF